MRAKARAPPPSAGPRASPADSRPESQVADWNVLATSLEGRRDALLLALRKLGRFRPGGYRNVVIGLVEDRDQFLVRVREALAADGLLPTALAKVVPIETTTLIDADTAVDTLATAAEPFLDRLAGGSFFVRLERRGLKGRLHSPSVEREVGDRVWIALAARGHTPRVDFTDPDAVLVIETIGDRAGLAVISRELRRSYPFVKVR
jgi:tRNA(Ser,Leu) C12 N-acetylase TAN1